MFRLSFIPAACVLLFAAYNVSHSQAQWALDTVITVGTNPTGIAITSDGSKLVVTDKTSPGKVVVMSTLDYSVSDIDVSSIENNPNGVVITPDNATALVTTTHKVIFIDLTKNSVKGQFTAPCAGTTLYGIAVTPSGTTAVFPDLSSGCTGQGLRMIDAAGPTSGSSFIPISTTGVLYGIAISHDSTSAIVTTSMFDSPKIVNLLTSAVQGIAGISGSYGVAMLHGRNEAVLFDGDSVDHVSLTNKSVIKKISYLSYNTTFQSIAVTADDKYAFVVGAFEKLVISLASDSVIQTFTAGGTNVAAAPDGSRFYVTDAYNGTVRVYKMAAPTAVRTLEGVRPTGYRLLQNYPNPFNPTTTIEFSLSDRSYVQVDIYDALGRLVRNLFSGEKSPGTYRFEWDGKSESGLPLSSGVYFYRLRTDKFADVKRMLYLK
ncbi:MAG: T9SS type A sorting domain-containing protein [Bacteroidetes bacterium]|nr:T9SS type A sorting domain-containing protein [Bacteroidota bacterium]